MKKVLLIVLATIVIAVTVIASYTKLALPDVGQPGDLQVQMTPERVANGSYLANHVTLCMDCHSTRDWSRFSGPMIEGTNGTGGELFNETMGFPGTFYSKNITPYSIKNWTDGELFRAITTGVTKSGSAIFPVMPYHSYGKMDKEDIYDIIAYIRTLQPIESRPPEHVLNFPMNFILNTIPSKASLSEKPLRSDTLLYGAYLTNASACMDCHTPVDNGQIIESLAFSGGRVFQFPNGEVRSANLTSDKASGLGSWTADQFVARFKAYENPKNIPVLKANELNTIMPWTMFAGMDTSDLRSIFTYLQSLKPIPNKVDHFVAAKS